MMRKARDSTSDLLARHYNVDYLPSCDRYIFSRDEPRHKVNVIGSGMMGCEHMKVTMLEGRATIHGVYDPSPLSVEKAQEMFSRDFGGQLVAYDSLEAACGDPEVDGLIICTPNYTHVEIVREAVKSKKHILLEKPIATTLQDASEIVRLAKDYEAVFQIGLQYRYKAIYVEAMHEALERKTIGDVKTVSMVEHRVPFLDKVGQWNKFSEYSGGTLVEKCCHYFDLLNLFAQSRPMRVYATGGMAVNFLDFSYENRKSDIIDNAFVSIAYENGVQASFNLCMFAPMFYEEIVVCGDEGRLKAYENEDYLPVERPNTHLEIVRGKGGPSKVSTPCYLTEIQRSGHHGSTFYEHKAFMENIEGEETASPSLDEGFWSIVVGVAAEKSAKTGEVTDIAEMLKEVDVVL